MNDLVIKIIADGLVIPIVIIGAWALVYRLPPRANRLEVYSRILMAGLTAYLAAKLIGAIYQPQTMRPFEVVGGVAGASYLNNPGFPSDHVLFCMAITLAVWFETRTKKVAWLLLGLTLTVGMGRMLALVHTPLDVLGGFVIACAGIPWYLQREPKATQHKHIGTEARKKSNHAVK